MLAPTHGLTEQRSPFNGPNIEICMILYDNGIKTSFRNAVFQHNLRNGRYMVDVLPNNMYVPEPFRICCPY